MRRRPAEYKRIAAKLDPNIQFSSVPRNHDVDNEPTRESLVRYRQIVGPDYRTSPSATDRP